MGRKLIVNADDFGLTRGINLAVSECAKAGVVRSATLMPNGEAFDDAVKTAKGWEGFGIGIHFVLTDLKPLLPLDRLHGLANHDGFLPSSPGELLKKIAGRKSLRDAIRRELFAQAEKVFDSGIRVTHFDSHKHVHSIPGVLDIIIEIAKRFSVKTMRDPFEAEGAWRFFHDMEKDERSTFVKQCAGARASILARPFFKSRVGKSGIQTPDALYGISPSGFVNEKVIRRICGMLKPGVSEFMTHPGIVDADLERCKTRLMGSRAREKDLLISTRVKELFERHDIILSHFGELGQ